ncbi:uncharacterized protein MONOS_2925 [Monocercomonoides exilis]|uniref:uncharacterized protein n=1 Tax=Monocercomonoides exilis TaxID=2049356 RepID=UPI0035593CBC|nr:hypothetical protein MONOS_2925 [Monocercomonoides exilis]|eukprot:MONOS_2925.1-p1 / transcript=MONOS_2925.1 / gene=MONOS_2925 / organism=Monocercomonoides_exilis_PA203 / gene_product=unspecified product / transcript_product=unspecified product / location=Mono_scaffold00064:28069-28788(-) / protein_length=240 / sequence_SO=supercontig / SO=protein_coding / is_pseudo=false
MEIEATNFGPASEPSSIFSAGGSTGSLDLSQSNSTSSSTSPISQTQSSQSHSESQVIPSTNKLATLSTELFGEAVSAPIFNFQLDRADVKETRNAYESLSFVPFIPSQTHAHSRSSNWIKDALDSSGWRVEQYLFPALKALILLQDEGDSQLDRLTDAVLMIINTLQEARHSRIQAEYGFKAARVFKDGSEDPHITSDKLEIIKPILEAKRSSPKSQPKRWITRTKFFRVQARCCGPRP